MNSQQKSTQLAKNTIILYVRMLCTMLLALYTSRIVLNALGVEDYGLYNVVGGVVAMLTVVTAGLATSTQRFLSFELGKTDQSNLKKVFSMCFITHLFIIFVIIILAETIGVWFLNSYLSIPFDRTNAANWLFQFSLLAISLNVLVVPYTACVISHEKMQVYAFICIFDSIFKLVIAYLLSIATIDKLVLYGLLMAMVPLLDFILYLLYCRKHFYESHFTIIWDKKILKSILSFSSWTMVGQSSMVVANQGNNILINIFHSVSVNAALGIANQVNAAITSLTSNFFTAFQPQITKSYSSNDFTYLSKLLFGSSKLSFFLIFLVGVPVAYNLDIILKLWLGTVPQYTNVFCLIFIISSAINAIGNPFWTALFANGNIKNMQILSAFFYFLDVVILYFFFKLEFSPIVAPMVKLCADICITCTRIFFVKKYMPFISLSDYCKNVILPILLSVTLVVLVGYLFRLLLNSSSLNILATTFLIIYSLFVTYFIGLSKSEKDKVYNVIIRKLYKNENSI